MLRRLVPVLATAALLAAITLGALLAPATPPAGAQGQVPTSTRVPPTATPGPTATPVTAYLPALHTGAVDE